MKILLVEDKVGAPIQRVLTKQGHEVSLAGDGESAIRSLNAREFDFFVVDLLLPGYSGIELSRRIRHIPRYERTPILLISGRAEDSDVKEARAAGVDDYIAKPFSVSDLHAKIQEVIANAAKPSPRRKPAETEEDMLPPAPAVFDKIRKLAADPDSEIREWAQVIRMDPALGAIALRHVRSPSYGFRERVTDVERAVVLLGKGHVEQLVSAATLQQLSTSVGESSFSLRAFWLHSVSVAYASHILALPADRATRTKAQEREFAQLGISDFDLEALKRIDLSTKLKLDDPALPFTAGLLHDIGKLLVASYQPPLYRRIVEGLARYRWSRPMLTVEREIGSNADHVLLGEKLALKWHLGKPLAGAIRYHHEPIAGNPYSLLLGVADLCAHAVFAFPEEAQFPMKNASISGGDAAPIDPFLPLGLADLGVVSSVDLDELQLILAPTLRKLTNQMQTSVGG